MEEFVGRVAELGLLDSALDGARRGVGRLITVTGPAGVGKTRFCEEGADRARAAGFAVIWGRCWTDSGAPALWPWHSILTQLCGRGDATELLDGASGVDTLDPQRFSRFVAVGELLAQQCAHTPLLLVLDDVHAADPGALLLARFVARSLHGLPLVMIATGRPDAVGPDSAPLLEDLEREGAPIVLGGLDLDETRTFLAGHDAGRLDPDLVEAVHAVSEGSPLFLRRLVALADPVAGLPHGLTSVIDESLRSLRPTTVRLLTTSAVLGMAVPVAEAAALVGMSQVAVLGALREVAGSGLAYLADPDTFTFCHDLVRQNLADRLTSRERLDAHAAAAEMIRVSTARGRHERLSQLAHHAVNAAPRSTGDALMAVAACGAAARSMARHFAYEQAATQLSTAVRLYDSAGLGPVPARLLLDWAYAVYRCGQLSEARSRFEQAADAAQAEGNAVLFAEAVLGVGGMWVNESRDGVERTRVLGLQLAALARLPAGHRVLRCRLTTRVAAEVVHDGGAVDGLLAALEQARLIGDQRVLAEALSLCHQALLAPEHARTRLDLAEELISVASAVGLDVVTLVGVCWRTVDLFHLGDPRAERAMTDLRRRSDLLSCHSVRFVLAAIEVLVLIRAGDLAAAERQAEQCFRLGSAIGDPDAVACHGAQLMAIRWLQGRSGEVVELAEQTANLPTLPDRELTFHATLALLAADAGQYDRARMALHRLTVGGLSTIRHESTWLARLFAVVEAAATLGEPEAARQAYELLAPFADLPIIPSLAVVCFGSTERSLGLAALTFGDTDRAVAHLERAVTANIRLANRPLTAYARATLAEALRRRGAAGDLARADDLLEAASAEATAMGMTARAAAWAAARQADPPSIAITRDGARWRLGYRGRDVLVDDLVGMRYLARLVARPGAEIPALDLVSAGHPSQPANHAVIDGAARAAYTRRARELAEEIADARGNADLARVERLELELDALTAELEHATGRGGRPRHFRGPAEQARTAVRKAITRAINAIEPAEPDAAATLRATVTTGYRCVYQPR